MTPEPLRRIRRAEHVALWALLLVWPAGWALHFPGGIDWTARAFFALAALAGYLDFRRRREIALLDEED